MPPLSLKFRQITSEPLDNQKLIDRPKLLLLQEIHDLARDLEVPNTGENIIRPRAIRSFRRGITPWNIGAKVQVESLQRCVHLELRAYQVLPGCPEVTTKFHDSNLCLAEEQVYVGLGAMFDYVGHHSVGDYMWPVDRYTLRFVTEASLQEAIILLKWLRTRTA